MINLTFETYEEMITFAKQILKGFSTPQPAQTQVPIANTVQAQPPTTPVAPTLMPTYTVDQIAVAAMQLKDSGRLEEFRQLLAKFGVAALTQLQPNQLPELAADLQKIGVKL